MELFRYLPDKTANGVFGPKTETAVKTFQTDAQKFLRVDKSSGKLVQATSVRYQGVVDGVVEQMVRDEIAVWKEENFLRPLPCLYYDDFDNEAIKLGVKSAPPTTSQRSGASTQNDYHDTGLPVLELQKLLNQIGAYAGKLDGWFGDKMKAAVELFQMHAEKGEFTDAAGNPVKLPEDGRLAKGPRGGVTIAIHESTKKTAAKNLKIKASRSGIPSDADIMERINERIVMKYGGENDCSHFTNYVLDRPYLDTKAMMSTLTRVDYNADQWQIGAFGPYTSGGKTYYHSGVTKNGVWYNVEPEKANANGLWPRQQALTRYTSYMDRKYGVQPVFLQP
jgi:hypothetical protein